MVGKTSAKQGAKDYQIEPMMTQREFLANADDIEREIHVQTERGKRCLNMVCALISC